MPTKWFFSALLGVFLLGSAAFGGLNDVPAAPTPQVEVGEAFVGAQLSVSVEAAVLIDAFPEASIEPDPGKRLLVIRAIVENVWDYPVETRAGSGAADNIRPRGIKDLDENLKTVAVISDATKLPRLQPNVPIELAYIWQVPAHQFAADDVLRVDLLDKKYVADGFITYGERFEDPFVAAYTEVGVTDVGAGVAPPEEAP